MWYVVKWLVVWLWRVWLVVGCANFSGKRWTRGQYHTKEAVNLYNMASKASLVSLYSHCGHAKAFTSLWIY